LAESTKGDFVNVHLNCGGELSFAVESSPHQTLVAVCQKCGGVWKADGLHRINEPRGSTDTALLRKVRKQNPQWFPDAD
jgi:hypothetical protein